MAEQIVDTALYPLSDPDSPKWSEIVVRARQELAEVGCCVLPDFIRPELAATLRNEGRMIAPMAYCEVATVNVYNTGPDAALPVDHPGRIVMQRGNAFVPHDRMPRDLLIHRLYTSAAFQSFVAACFGLPQLFELADPLAGLCLNVITPGREHPWHFDKNEFTVSLLTQDAEEGGRFEYCPNLRAAGVENFAGVLAVLTGKGAHLIRGLTLRPGDLQLFKGRYSLHRVSPVRGATARHSAIFAYTERPGVIGGATRTRQLFGRVLPEHVAAEAGSVRVDQLLD